MVMRLSHYDVGGYAVKQVTAIDSIWTSQQEIWAAIRAMRTFTSADLQMVLPKISKDIITKFVSRLHRYGYLRKTGKNGAYNRYRIIRDSGPMCPVMRSRKLFDRNDKTFVERGR